MLSFVLKTVGSSYHRLFVCPSQVASDIAPLRLFVAWVRQFDNGRVRVVTTPLVDALHQLGQRSLRQRSPFVVEVVKDVSDDDDED